MTHRRAVRTRIKANRERRGRFMSTDEYLAWRRQQLFCQMQLLCGICSQAIPDTVWFDPRVSNAFVCADCIHDAAALAAVYAPPLADQSPKG